VAEGSGTQESADRRVVRVSEGRGPRHCGLAVISGSGSGRAACDAFVLESVSVGGETPPEANQTVEKLILRTVPADRAVGRCRNERAGSVVVN